MSDAFESSEGLCLPSVERGGATPIHQQIAGALRAQIRGGNLSPGAQIPSIRAIASQLAVNPLTVRQALGVLNEQGLVESRPGRGTFVTSRRGASSHLALMIPRIGDALSSQISDGVRSVTAVGGGRVSIFDAHDDPEALSDCLNRLEQYGIDGAIVFPQLGHTVARSLLELLMGGFPTVLVDRIFPDVASWGVVSDNFAGGRVATRMLVESGCQNIAFVSALNCSSTRDRFSGYVESLAEHHHVFRRELVREVHDVAPSVREAVRDLLHTTPRPDGIFFGTDTLAIFGMQEIRAGGLRVPDDIAIVGFDDIPAASLVEPQLTTIRQNGCEIGRRAALLLQERLCATASHLTGRIEVVPVTPIIRGTTRHVTVRSVPTAQVAPRAASHSGNDTTSLTALSRDNRETA